MLHQEQRDVWFLSLHSISQGSPTFSRRLCPRHANLLGEHSISMSITVADQMSTLKSRSGKELARMIRSHYAAVRLEDGPERPEYACVGGSGNKQCGLRGNESARTPGLQTFQNHRSHRISQTRFIRSRGSIRAAPISIK